MQTICNDMETHRSRQELASTLTRSVYQEASFRDEKHRIVQAMGGSRAELVSPSVDPRLQRKLSRTSIGTSRSSSLYSDPEQPAESDGLPVAFDHQKEHELYDLEEGGGNKVGKKTLYCLIAVAVLLLIIGGVVGAVLAFVDSGNPPSVDIRGDSDTDDSCSLNREDLALCENGMLAVPECAREAFQELKEAYLSEEELACDAAHQGLVALAVAQTNSDDGVDDPTEFFILSTLFFSLGGVQWQTDENWLEGTSPCNDENWYGVECYPDGSFDIWLAANRLQGSLPTEIGMLSNLRSLSIGRNEVEGTLPSEIGLLTDLRALDLTLTEIQSTVPSEIGMLQELTALNLSFARFAGTIPTEIGNLINLGKSCFLQVSSWYCQDSNIANFLRITVDLLFSEAQFTGTLPSEMGNLVGLEGLSMDGVQSLTGSIPSEWETMTSLQRFSIAAFGLDRSPMPSFINTATNLREVRLLFTEHTGSVDSFVHLSSLRVLVLGLSQLTGTIPTEIGLLTDLEQLSIKFSPRIEGTLPTEVALLTNLFKLELLQSDLTGTIPSELANLAKLKVLDLRKTDLTGSIPIELCELETAEILTCPEGHRHCGIDSCNR